MRVGRCRLDGHMTRFASVPHERSTLCARCSVVEDDPSTVGSRSQLPSPTRGEFVIEWASAQ